MKIIKIVVFVMKVMRDRWIEKEIAGKREKEEIVLKIRFNV